MGAFRSRDRHLKFSHPIYKSIDSIGSRYGRHFEVTPEN